MFKCKLRFHLAFNKASLKITQKDHKSNWNFTDSSGNFFILLNINKKIPYFKSISCGSIFRANYFKLLKA